MEQLKIFNKDRKYLGIASREEVHLKGLWHETFHCWIKALIDGKEYLYFQLRSKDKKDYPGLLDITAAGHLLSHENVDDGIREVEEEIGIKVSMDELSYLGVIPYEKELEGFIDREHAHVYLLNGYIPLESFSLQAEEVSGIFMVPLEDFYQLWFGNKKEVSMEGIKENSYGERSKFSMRVDKKMFVPHSDSFYKETLEALRSNRG
ncbi:NUDIX domain-containing protein [Sutcliffiella horikoshii]|uniref:NUDIX domain-containing protein n=1 Tax=Sutcliffiella horikoshii TaxID=79883 RepID=A0A5D4T3V3_9BACI|nr:NUDIX domain-containing protein [Sutcliffiella horikoshii]TYS70380.1 NUDIX domain-containing protein [Sutcliffiella horikoshii]